MNAHRLGDIALILIAAFVFVCIPLAAHAQVVGPTRGGTGISTIPSYGQVLVGNANGTYTLTATSSLGISGGGGTTFTASYPLQLASSILSLAFGTTTANAWSQLQTFTSGLISQASSTIAALHLGTPLEVQSGGTASTTLTGILKGNGTGQVQTAVSGTDYQGPITLTTTGSSGAATFDGTTLNVPQYAGTTYTGTYPVQVSGSAISLAFGTSSSNTWGGTQTFTNPIVDGSLSGLIAGNSGTTYAAGTSTLTASSPLTGSFVQVGSGGSLGCQTASGSQAGCLSSGDWTTFNNKLGSYDAFTHPATGQSATTSLVLAFGHASTSQFTATSSVWLTGTTGGVLKTDANGLVGVGANGTDFTLITAKTCSGTDKLSAVTAAGVFTCTTDTTGSGGAGTVSTSTTPTIGQLAYWTSSGNWPETLGKVATGTISNGTNITVTNGGSAAVVGSNITIGISGTIAYANGGTGTTTAPIGQLIYGGATAYQSVATSSASNGTGISLSGSGALVGAGGLTITNTGVIALGPTGQTTSGTATFASSTTGTDFTITGSGSTITFNLPTASASNRGLLSSSDWSTFNGKLSSYDAFTHPSASVSATTSSLLVNAGTSTITNLRTVNASSTNATTSSLYITGITSKILKTDGSGQVLGAANGTDYTLITAQTCSNQAITALTAAGGSTCSSITDSFLSGAISYAHGGTGTTTGVTGQLAYYGASAYQAVATSSFAVSSSFSYSGTLGALVGGTGGTLSIANGGISNAMLANSTISGVSLGSNLNSLSHDSTLTGTSYNGSAAVSNWGLDLTHSNAWTGLQTFANASSSLLSVTSKLYVGGSATTTIDSSGNVVLPSGANLTITGKSDGCATFSSGQLNSTGVACGSGGGGGLATSSPVSAGNLLEYSSAGAGTAFGVATSSLSITGPFIVPANTNIVGTGGAVIYTGLATTSQPASSNLLVSNGGAGVYGVATSTLTAGSGLSGSFTQVGSGGSVSCVTANATTFGCLSAADWLTFNNKVATSASETAGQLAAWGTTSGTPAKLYSVATSSESITGPFNIPATYGKLVGGSGSITYYGLATTSQPSSSNLLVSNGTSGVYGVATSSVTINSPLSGTLTGIGSGQSLSLGTVPYGNGGTNATTNWTQGSVFFAGSSAFAQNNSNFFWDNSLGSLDLGTSTSKLGTLTIASSTAPQIFFSSGAGFNQWFAGNRGGNFYIGTSTYSATSTFSAFSLIPHSLSQIVVGATSSVDALGSTNVANFLNEPLGTGSNASSTIVIGDTSTTTSVSQIQLNGSNGTTYCIFVNNSGTLTTQSGKCN